MTVKRRGDGNRCAGIWPGPCRPDGAARGAAPDRVARGKDGPRAVAPLESHAEFSPGPGAGRAAAGVRESRWPGAGAVCGARWGRLVLLFTFYRGAALPMAADLAGHAPSGLRV